MNDSTDETRDLPLDGPSADRRLSEETLRESERRLRHITQATSVYLYEIDRQGAIRFVNRTYPGLTENDVVGTKLTDWFPEDLRTPIAGLVDAVFSTGQDQSTEYTIPDPEGRVHSYTCEIALASDSDSDPRAVLTATDVTDKVEADRALEESEARFRQLFNEMKDGMAVYEAVDGGKDFVFKDINAAGERIGDIRKSEVVGKSLREIRPAIDEFGLLEVMRRVWQTGQTEYLPEKLYEDKRHRGWFDNCVYRLDSGDVVALFADHSDRRQAADSLRLKDQIFDSSIAANSIADAKGVVTECNASFLEVWGYADKRDVIDKPIPEFIVNLEDAEMILAALTADGRWRGDYEAKRGDGGTFTASAFATVLRGAEGEVIGYHSSVLDVTEQRLAEEELRAERRLSEDYLDSLPGLFYVFDDKGFVRWNKAWLQFAGYTDEDLAGKSPPDFFQGGDVAAVADTVVRVFREGSADIEASLVTKDGRRIPYYFTGVRTTIDGRDHLVGLGVDVSDRWQAQEALRKSEEQYRNLAENIGIGVAMISPDMKVLTLNRQMREWFPGVDATAKPICYRAFNNPPNEEPCSYCPTIKTLEDGETHESTTATPTGDGVRHFRVLSTPVRDPDGIVVAAIEMVEDVTERVHAESERAALEAQLRQSQKMESVGRLAGGVAHDFNNLLTVIINYADMIGKSLGPDDPLRRDADEIHSAGTRGAELTQQLLAFSRKQVIEPRVMDLNSITSGARKMLERIIGEDIELVFALDDQLKMVTADSGQMNQILVNLAVNARDAMPGGGKLVIETSNIVLDENYSAHHPHTKPGRYVMLGVSDTGCGMDRDVLANAFEPFFTTKGVGEGTGLGLATVYGIVKQSGGSVEVYSEVGHGTTFKVYLPATEGVEDDETREQFGDTPRGRETILLIEDEEPVRRVARRILEISGYKLLLAAHPGEALVIARQHGGSIDLVLTDVIMPNMSGTECYEHLKEIVPGVKVLYMSGYTANAISHQGVLDEGTQFIQKPFTVDALARKVREVLDSPV